MIKEKTVTMTVCDFCVNEDRPVWRCALCEKDACGSCGRDYAIYSTVPVSRTGMDQLFGTLTSISRGIPEFVAFVCNDCWKSQLPTGLLRAGFKKLTSEMNQNVA
jgi:hypothetical protein